VSSPTSLTAEQLTSIRAARPHLKFVEAPQRGYVVVEITRERLQADWWFVPTITERVSDESRAIRLVSEAGAPRLVAMR
jgi:alkaline phosphatase D